MVNVSPEYVELARIGHDVTSAPVRDHMRLKELKKRHPDWRIVSFNDTHSEKECHPNLHYQGSWSRRCAKGVLDLLPPAHRARGYQYIFVDYFRFPGAYSEAYVLFFTGALPSLIQQGAVTDSTAIIAPNSECIRASVTRSGAISGLGAQRWYLSYHPISAAENELFTVTDSPSVQQSQSLGQYDNNKQVVHLGRPPFLRITLVSQRISAGTPSVL
jgi:hypothetical protein